MALFQKYISCFNCNIGQTRCMGNYVCQTNKKCKLLIVGGGVGGCSVAWRFAKKLGYRDIIVLDPSPMHFNQPSFSLVAAGMGRLKDTHRPLPDVLPPNATWIQDYAALFEPNNNMVHTCKNAAIEYDYMVVAVGLVNNFDKIWGLQCALDDPNSGVSTIYSPQYCCKTWCDIQHMRGGSALFTFPSDTVKCPGASQKIMFLAEHYFRKNNTRDMINMTYLSGREKLFGIEKYAESLQHANRTKSIPLNFCCELVEVGKREALFHRGDEHIVLPFNMLHVSPPMSPPAPLSRSALADNRGYLTVDQHTMQHTAYPNVFGLGDCTDSPNGKTAAAIGPQSAVLEANLTAAMKGKAPSAQYDGYSACPVVTSYGTAILAEFGYDKKVMETFPFDQSKDSRLLYYLETRRFPKLYWNRLLKGKWDGPHRTRKFINPTNRFYITELVGINNKGILSRLDYKVLQNVIKQLIPT